MRVLERIERERSFARPVLDAVFRREAYLGPAERSTVTRLVRGTLQRQTQLDYVLEGHLPRGLAGTDERVGWVLRVGAFRLLYEDGLPTPIAVDSAVELCRDVGRPRLAGLVNAVLRKVARQADRGPLPAPDPETDPDGHLAVRGSLPRWLAARWRERFGLEEALQLAESLNQPSRLTARVHPPATPSQVIEQLAAAGISAEAAGHAPDSLVLGSPGALDRLPELLRGELFIQDEASTLVGHLVAPEPGWQVLDVCASPGGKSAHLAGLLGGTGQVEARDRGRGRMRALRRLAERLPLRLAERDLLEPLRSEDLGAFDAVLLDAPCSNSGTLRRHPEAKLRLEEGIFEISAVRQRRMLAASAPLVRPGGVLVYSVCSFAPEEAWSVVDPFLASPEGSTFRVEPPVQEGVFASLLDARGALRTLPHLHQMDGFFAVRLRRSSP